MKNLIPQFIHDNFKAGSFSGQLEAVAMFVDISGFTTMTEVLMQHGKEGAEVLAETLRSVFDPMINQVYGQGGIITGFAGDAFTALFPSDNYHLSIVNGPFKRALAAARNIQQTIIQNGSQHTRFGDFPFAVKIGIANGLVEWGILHCAIQTERYTYFFRGTAIDRCAVAEQVANPNEIVLSQDVSSTLRDQIITSSRTDHHECLEKIGFELPAPTTLTAWEIESDVARAFFPPEITQMAMTGEFRRIVTVFLCWRENMSTVELPKITRLVFNLLQTYDGFFTRFDFGDKGCNFLLFWGTPIHHENDVERTLNFLLDLTAALPELGKTGLTFRAGVTWQMMYSGYTGGRWQGEFSCYGRGINLAARMAMKADWGEIWLDQPVVKKAWSQFDIDVKGSYYFKGFDKPQPVGLLHGRSLLSQSIFYEGRPVGRETELNQLHDFIRPILTPAPHFAGQLAIYGEAGLGKSRLVYEFRQQLKDQVLWCQCACDEIFRQSLYPFRLFLKQFFHQSRVKTEAENREKFEQKTAHLKQELAALQTMNAPFSQLIESILNEFERTTSLLAALCDVMILNPTFDQMEPKLRFENTLYALKNLFKALSLLQPVIVFVDDIQWLDADSRQFIDMLVLNIESFPIALVATGRYLTDGSKPSLVTLPPAAIPRFELDLTHLSDQSIHALVEQLLKGPADPKLIAFLHAKTAGNPYFTEQLTLHLKENQLLQREADVYTLSEANTVDVPPTITDVLISRLDRLPLPVKLLVQTAAVLGVEFEIPVLQHMLQENHQVQDELSIAAQAAIWNAKTDMDYIFRHALMRDAAYEMQLTSQLHKTHLAAARAIEAVYAIDPEPHFSSLAYHYECARQHDSALAYYQKAGEFAQKHYQNETAIAHFQKVLDLLPEDQSAQGIDSLLNIGQILLTIGKTNIAVETITQALAIATAIDDPHMIVKCRLDQVNVMTLLGDYATGLAICEAVADQLKKMTDPALKIRLPILQGDLFSARGDHGQAMNFYQQALEIIDSISDEPGKCPILTRIGTVYLQQAHFDEARSYFEKSLAIAEKNRIQKSIIQNQVNIGLIHFQLNEMEKALDNFESFLKKAREMGDRHFIAYGLRNLGYVADARKDHETAIVYYDQLLELAKEIGSKKLIINAMMSMGESMFLLGNRDTGLGHIQQAIQLAEEIDNGEMIGYGNIMYGELLITAGQFEIAEQALLRAREYGEKKNDPMLTNKALYYLGQLFIAQKKHSKSLEYLQEALNHPEVSIYIEPSVILLMMAHCYFELKDLDKAKEIAHQILSQAAEAGDLNIQIKTLNLLAYISAEKQDIAKGLEYFQQAQEMAQTDFQKAEVHAKFYLFGLDYKRAEIDPECHRQEALNLLQNGTDIPKNYQDEDWVQQLFVSL